jgi:hypothetical protein
MSTKKESELPGSDQPRRVGRPRKAESFRRLVAVALAEQPELQTQELLKRATAEGYDGGKSAFYDMVATTRDPARAQHARDPLPGECSRHDLVEVMIEHVDGSRRRTRLFVSRLEYSRWLAITVVHGDGIEPIARALVDHFTRAGGVPLLATFDSRRLGAAGADAPSEFVSALAYLALDLGVGIELPQPSRSRAGAAERLVRLVKDEVVPHLHAVRDESDLVRQIDAAVAAHNTRIAIESGRSPMCLLSEERRRLRPIRVSLADLTLRVPIVVQQGGIVVHEGRKYMISSDAAGVSGMLFVSAEQIRIVAGSVIGIFTRFFPPMAPRGAARL